MLCLHPSAVFKTDAVFDDTASVSKLSINHERCTGNPLLDSAHNILGVLL